MKTVAIIQARMSSSRLPGKVMLPVGDSTMLGQVVRRVRQSQKVHEVVVAASNLPADEPIWEWCNQHGVACVRGDSQDVLSRYADAARATSPTHIVRITSDCPLIDPTVIDATVAAIHSQPHLDYACNFYPVRTFPRGLDVEVMTDRCLRRVDQLATRSEYREHVTLMIYREPRRFRIGSHLHATCYSDLRWTVDTSQDLELVQSIYKWMPDSDFGWLDVIAAYRNNPHWRHINDSILQKAA